MDSLWRGKAPLLLASKSPARRALLTAAAIPFQAIAADIDEEHGGTLELSPEPDLAGEEPLDGGAQIRVAGTLFVQKSPALR